MTNREQDDFQLVGYIRYNNGNFGPDDIHIILPRLLSSPLDSEIQNVALSTICTAVGALVHSAQCAHGGALVYNVHMVVHCRLASQPMHTTPLWWQGSGAWKSREEGGKDGGKGGLLLFTLGGLKFERKEQGGT